MDGTSLSDPMIQQISQLFLSMSDPSRIRILRCLLENPEPISVGEVARATGLSQANTSKHLSLLVRVGLANREPRGTLVFFSPVMPLVGKVCDLVCGHVLKRSEDAFHALH